jgi:hypothetical protein
MMRAIRVRLGEGPLESYVGAVVAANVRGGGAANGALKKGHRLTADDLPALAAVATQQPDLAVPLLLPDPGDVPEDAAAVRLGALIAGPGVQVHDSAQGKVRLAAATRGLVRIDGAALARLNAVPGISIYTLFDNQPVDAGTIVAEAKCTPLMIAEAQLAEAEGLATLDADYGAVVDVLPFAPARTALLIRERLEGTAAERVRAGLGRKLGWFGATLLPQDGPPTLPDDAVVVAAHLESARAAGADLILTAGGSLSDPFDATLVALQRRGASPTTAGVPIHPGSLLWVAYLDTVSILGVPSCGLLSESTAFDIVLPRLLARGRAALSEAATWGHGGLLAAGQAYRFPPYRET